MRKASVTTFHKVTFATTIYLSQGKYHIYVENTTHRFKINKSFHEQIVFRLMWQAWTLFWLMARTFRSFTSDLGETIIVKGKCLEFHPNQISTNKNHKIKRLTGNLYAPPVGLQLVQTPSILLSR